MSEYPKLSDISLKIVAVRYDQTIIGCNPDLSKELIIITQPSIDVTNDNVGFLDFFRTPVIVLNDVLPSIVAYGHQ